MKDIIKQIQMAELVKQPKIKDSKKAKIRKIPPVIRGIILLSFTGLFLLMLHGILAISPDIDLGVLKVHWYALTLLSAFTVCVMLVSRLAAGEPELVHVDVWEGLVFLFVPAIIGARIYHVVTDFQLYSYNLLNVFAIWNGGLGFIGGVIGGALGLYFFTRYRKLPLNLCLSLVAVVVPLGQAIGRLGNFFNHELYGPPTDLPWGQFIPEAFRKPEYIQYAFFQPLFLYEALANLLLFAILWRLWHKGERSLKLVIIYLAGYGAIRFCLDFLRLDGRSGIYGLSYAQWLILFAYGAGAVYYLVKAGRPKAKDERSMTKDQES